jgi:hypothetical protein
MDSVKGEFLSTRSRAKSRFKQWFQEDSRDSRARFEVARFVHMCMLRNAHSDHHCHFDSGYPLGGRDRVSAVVRDRSVNS